MLIRNDIHGVERAPQSILTYLSRKGGFNVHGEPNFRLVWAPSRMKQQGGRFQTWASYLTTQERGGVMRTPAGLVVPSPHKPYRVVTEIRHVRKYLFDGWVLERWIPASYYGAKGDWYARVVPGTSIPLGGPYPVEGDFEMCHTSATFELPSISELQTAIDRSEKSRDVYRGDVEQIVLERHNEAVADYEAQMRKEEEEAVAYMNDLTKTLLNCSLGMGRHRSELAAKQGITEHVGN